MWKDPHRVVSGIPQQIAHRIRPVQVNQAIAPPAPSQVQDDFQCLTLYPGVRPAFSLWSREFGQLSRHTASPGPTSGPTPERRQAGTRRNETVPPGTRFARGSAGLDAKSPRVLRFHGTPRIVSQAGCRGFDPRLPLHENRPLGRFSLLRRWALVHYWSSRASYLYSLRHPGRESSSTGQRPTVPIQGSEQAPSSQPTGSTLENESKALAMRTPQRTFNYTSASPLPVHHALHGQIASPSTQAAKQIP